MTFLTLSSFVTSASTTVMPFFVPTCCNIFSAEAWFCTTASTFRFYCREATITDTQMLLEVPTTKMVSIVWYELKYSEAEKARIEARDSKIKASVLKLIPSKTKKFQKRDRGPAFPILVCNNRSSHPFLLSDYPIPRAGTGLS